MARTASSIARGRVRTTAATVPVTVESCKIAAILQIISLVPELSFLPAP